MHLAAPASGGSFGYLGAGGLALIATAILIFGVIGKGSRKLNTLWAGITAFVAGSAYIAAGKIWASPQQVVEQGWTGLGVGGAAGPFGEVGIGAACGLLVVLMVFAPLNPTRSAVLSLIAAFTWPMAGVGSIWAVPGQFFAALSMMVGGG
ncbi:hypothetical protein NW249_34225 [Streptomyces sp. OUCMDZ-4982]|uniref:hypothetical protein n=1 Tax=Streptomyces sp. OUCMDZ-4982 TaxID=2973090 RepID=UPI00215C31B7|nr:hypothetical protein [Streptomyces sp. OUCMDZ-4982]MCR8947146.1 hypothetical protein [Streptomyces sp. OUCMDZ-4982]